MPIIKDISRAEQSVPEAISVVVEAMLCINLPYYTYYTMLYYNMIYYNLIYSTILYYTII